VFFYTSVLAHQSFFNKGHFYPTGRDANSNTPYLGDLGNAVERHGFPPKNEGEIGPAAGRIRYQRKLNLRTEAHYD
jgi:hypothetical protein